MTRIYHLEGSATVPEYGAVELELDAELTEVDVDADGTRLVELVVPAAAQLRDRDGLRHKLRRPYDVQSFAAYYRQDSHGRLLEVHYHPREHWQALNMKKELISAQQLIGITEHEGGTASRPQAWTEQESDAGGTAEASYSMFAEERTEGRRLRSRSGSEETATVRSARTLVVHKRLAYYESEPMVRRELNTTAVLHPNETAVSLTQRVRRPSSPQLSIAALHNRELPTAHALPMSHSDPRLHLLWRGRRTLTCFPKSRWLVSLSR